MSRFRALIIVAALSLLVGCWGERSVSNSHTQQSVQSDQTTRQYTPPTIPAIISTEGERIEFLAQNYWRDFNFRDTTAIGSKVAERAFPNYLHILSGVPKDVADSSIKSLLESSSVDSLMFDNFIEICEKYLYDPNSPMRNDELYIPVLEYIISSPRVDEWNKVRPQYQLEMALKNRVGERATDFVITQNNGSQTKLSKVSGDYKVVLFNNPDCPDCKRVKEFIENNPNIFSQATIISIYVDSDIELWRSTIYPKEWVNGYDKGETINTQRLYDLKAIPTLYLLDGEDKILLKDSSIEMVARYLYTSML